MSGGARDRPSGGPFLARERSEQVAEIPWNRNYFFLKGSGPAQRTEAPVAETPAGLEGGYTQTKWVAERIVTEAMKRNVPVTISRPGRITGHSTTGATNTDDFLILTMKGCELG